MTPWNKFELQRLRVKELTILLCLFCFVLWSCSGKSVPITTLNLLYYIRFHGSTTTSRLFHGAAGRCTDYCCLILNGQSFDIGRLVDGQKHLFYINLT